MLRGFLVVTKSSSYLLAISSMLKSLFPSILQSQSLLMCRWHSKKCCYTCSDQTPALKPMRSKSNLVNFQILVHESRTSIRILTDSRWKKSGYYTSWVSDRTILLLALSWVMMWLLIRYLESLCGCLKGLCFLSFLIGWNQSCNAFKATNE